MLEMSCLETSRFYFQCVMVIKDARLFSGVYSQERPFICKNLIPNFVQGAFVWDQFGIRIVGIMQVSARLEAILIPEYLDSIPAILLPRAE